MPLEELEKAGVLLPKEEWGTKDMTTDVAKGPLLAVATLIPVSGVFMYVGGGRLLTWIGLVIYLIFLVMFTFLSLKGIRRGHDTAESDAKGTDEHTGSR